MGELFKRDGSEYWYAEYYDLTGKRRRRSTRTRDRQAANAKLRSWERGSADATSNVAGEGLKEAIDYLVDFACADNADGTVRCYTEKGGHLIRVLGEDRDLGAITHDDMLRYVAQRRNEGAHPHSIAKELTTLRLTLKASARRGRFRGTVAAVVPSLKVKYEPRRTYLTAEQFMRLANVMVRATTDRSHPEVVRRVQLRRARRVFYCMMIAFASPRRGELEAMRWETHVDLPGNRIVVARGKTVSRPIRIHPQLRPWLEVMGDRAGWSGLVVEPWLNVGRDLPAACKRAGVPRCTPNDLRRTFASWLVQEHVSLFVVATLLGHSSTRMVEKVYGRLDDATLDAAIGRLPGGDDWVNSGARTVHSDGTVGAPGTDVERATKRQGAGTHRETGASAVPRAGIEPATRGFSVPSPNFDSEPKPQVKLTLIP